MTAPREGVLPDYLPAGDVFLTSPWAVSVALSWMARTGLKPVLDKGMTATTGRPRKLSPFQALTLIAVHVVDSGDMVLTDVARRAVWLTDAQWKALRLPCGLRYWNVTDALDDLVVALLPFDHPARVDLVTGEIIHTHELGMDVTDFANRLLAASIPECFAPSTDQALDSTDFSAYAQAFGKPTDEEMAAADHLAGNHEAPTTGMDRPPVSRDPDARWGWRSRNNVERTQRFLGFDAHFLVDVAPCGGGKRPALARAMCLAPAGSSKTRAGLAALDAFKTTTGTYPRVLLADRGYSPGRPETWALPLKARGVGQVFDLHKTQRTALPDPARGCVWIGGWPYLLAMPKALWQDDAGNPRTFASPVGIMTPKTRVEREAAFDALAPWAYRHHSHNPTTGLRRYTPPRVRCPNTPASLSLPYSFPTTQCQPGCTCGKTISAGPEWLSREHQRHPFGSIKWRADYKRRVAVESFNAELKTNRGALRRGTSRVLGLAKNTILLALYAGAVNARMIRDAYDHHPDAPGPDTAPAPSPALVRRRKPRRTARHRLLAEAAALGPPG